MKEHLFNRNALDGPAATEAQIPIIDLGPYFRSESGALGQLADELKDACTQVGFFLYQKSWRT